MTAVRTPTRTTPRRAIGATAAPRPAQRRPRLTVAEAPPAPQRWRALWIVGVLTFLVAVLVVMASQALLVQAQDRLDGLQQRLTEQEAIAERQQLQLAQLQSPERVVAAATERLGMVPPDDVVHLRSHPGDDAAITAPPVYPAPADEPVSPDTQTEATDEIAAGDPPAVTGG